MCLKIVIFSIYNFVFKSIIKLKYAVKTVTNIISIQTDYINSNSQSKLLHILQLLLIFNYSYSLICYTRGQYFEVVKQNNTILKRLYKVNGNLIIHKTIYFTTVVVVSSVHTDILLSSTRPVEDSRGRRGRLPCE